MNRFSSAMLVLSVSLFAAACSKESTKAPETPSHLLPASGTEPQPTGTPPGMSPMEKASDELSPSSNGTTGPGQQLETNAPTDPSAAMPTAGGSGGSGGGGKGGSGSH